MSHDIVPYSKAHIFKDFVSPEDFQFNQQEHDTYTQAWFDGLTFEPQHIYIDLSLCKDIRLATLFEASKNIHNSFKTIYDGINIYDRRLHDNNIFDYYPSLIQAKDEYDKLITDTNKHPYLWMMSPHTFLIPFIALLFTIGQKSAMIHERVYRPTFHVNTYPFHVNVLFLQLLKQQFMYINPYFKMKILFKPYQDLTKDLIKPIEMFFVENLSKFLADGTYMYDCIFMKMQGHQIRIHTPKRIDFSLAHLQPNDDYEEILTDTEVCMKLLCLFEYFSPFILTADDYRPCTYHQDFMKSLLRQTQLANV
jgi:hypothetical protein